MRRRLRIASFSLVAALGCGAHLHRPQDASTAEGAAGELKAARLTEGFAEELAQSKAMLAEELAAAQTAAEVGRDRDLLDILAATGESDPETEILLFVRCRARFKGDGWATFCSKISSRLYALTGHTFAVATAPARREPEAGQFDAGEYLRRVRDLQRRWKGPNSGESQLARAIDEYSVTARALRLGDDVAPPPRCPLLDLPGRSPALQGNVDRLRGLCRERRDGLRALSERAVCRGPACGPSELGAQVDRVLSVHDALARHHDELVSRVYAYEAAKHPCEARDADPGRGRRSPGTGPSGQPPAGTPPTVAPPAGAPPAEPPVRPASGARAERAAARTDALAAAHMLPGAGPDGQDLSGLSSGPGPFSQGPAFLSLTTGAFAPAPFALSPGAGMIAQAPGSAATSTVTVRADGSAPVGATARADAAPATCDEALLQARFAALGDIEVPAVLEQHDLVPLGRLGRLYQLSEQLAAVEALIAELQLEASRRRVQPEVDPALVAGAPRFARVLQTTIEGIDRIEAALRELDLAVLALIRETLRVERDALAEAQVFAERRVRLERVKLAAQLEEAALLAEALTGLHKLELAGCAGQGLVAAHEAKKCRDDLTRALVAFGNAWTLGRAAQRQADVLDLGARHDASLARSRAAVAVREVYLAAGVAELVKFNKSGLAPEALAQLIVNTVGFAVLAGGVYAP